MLSCMGASWAVVVVYLTVLVVYRDVLGSIPATSKLSPSESVIPKLFGVGALRDRKDNCLRTTVKYIGIRNLGASYRCVILRVTR